MKNRTPPSPPPSAPLPTCSVLNGSWTKLAKTGEHIAALAEKKARSFPEELVNTQIHNVPETVLLMMQMLFHVVNQFTH